MDDDWTVQRVFRRDQVVVVAGLLVLTAAAWIYTVHLASTMGQEGMHLAAPHVQAWGTVDVVVLLVMWVVMMVAMMVPSAAPMILTFARVKRNRGERDGLFVSTAAFVFGYVLVWSAFSVLATAVQWGLHAGAFASPAVTSASPLVGGGILLVAGLFQWTPLKHACLTQCRSPLGFLLTGWREGARGALVMGIRHGAYCVGCCWMLMALLFVVGVMNLLWIAVLAGFVLLEKVTHRGEWVSRAAGLLLFGWGAWMVGTALI